MSLPVLTVITINYNNAIGLEVTIDSVTKQEYSPIEYIIIDGGSDDGSRQLIERNCKFLSYWISEKDEGVYNAMNKGIMKASGKYLLFLNSGDYLRGPQSLLKLYDGSQDEDLLYGDLFMQRDQASWLKSHPSILTFEYFLKDTISHPSTLIKRSLFEKVGLYSECYRIVSDWEFFMNAICRFNASYRHAAFPISVFHENGMSSDPENMDLINNEKENILSKYYSAFLPDYKKLEQYRSDLKSIMNSRMHRLIDKILKSSLYKSYLR